MGSSRAIEFVRHGFTSSMVNMGSMRDMAQIRSLLQAMFAAHRPKLVILTIDFWWFNSARSEEVVDLQPDTVGPLSLVQLAEPFQWIAQGKVGIGDFVAGALSPGFKPAGIGVAAIYDHAGYDDRLRLRRQSPGTGGARRPPLQSGRSPASWSAGTTGSTSTRQLVRRTGRAWIS